MSNRNVHKAHTVLTTSPGKSCERRASASSWRSRHSFNDHDAMQETEQDNTTHASARHGAHTHLRRGQEAPPLFCTPSLPARWQRSPSTSAPHTNISKSERGSASAAHVREGTEEDTRTEREAGSYPITERERRRGEYTHIFVDAHTHTHSPSYSTTHTHAKKRIRYHYQHVPHQRALRHFDQRPARESVCACE